MSSLHFRLPGRAAPLGHWLASLLPAIDRSTRRRWAEDGCVRIDGRPADRPGVECPAGARIEIFEESEELTEILRAEASSLGGRHSHWVGLIDEPPWRGGTLTVEGLPEMEFTIGERRDGLARIHLSGSDCSASRIRASLAEAGLPLVGDLVGGGLGVPGGPRLFADGHADATPIEWPLEPPWCEEDHSEQEITGPLALRVSDETARAIRKGHPWILPDGASDPVTRFRPGTALRIKTRDGLELALAHVEGTARLAARVWAAGSGDSKSMSSIESRIAKAIARRRDLLQPAVDQGTTAFRLVHGEGDDLPGLIVDRLGPLLRVLVTSRASDSMRARAIAALCAQLPVSPEGETWSILELLHLRCPAALRPDRVRWIAGGLDQLSEQGVRLGPSWIGVQERGLTFAVDPGWETPRQARPGYGLFFDQRENRVRTGELAARGGKWLNLFAHTGAFSASLLAAGAERVVSVDLSAAYLERLEQNLSLNRARGVDATRHASVRSDGRRFLEKLGPSERFAGIVLDPPTSAAAGRRFWSLQRDLEPILRQCVARLDDAGSLLVTQNRSGPPLGLDLVLERIATRAHRQIVRIEAAPAGHDHPSRPEFPEGDPFEGWLLELA